VQVCLIVFKCSFLGMKLGNYGDEGEESKLKRIYNEFGTEKIKKYNKQLFVLE